MKTILIVDDEEDIAELLSFNLRQSGYRVVSACDGVQAMACVRQDKPDLIILDWMLPRMDGVEVCKALRADPNLQHIAILMLSAKGEEIDKVLAIELGADDYLTKPFGMRELIARVKALLRRSQGSQKDRDSSAGILRSGALVIDVDKHEVTIDQIIVSLTKTEFDLLFSLAQSPKRVFNRQQLLSKVWGNDFYGDDRVVDVHIRRLRSKIEGVTKTPYIKTVRGVGYILY